ncbi:MAG: sugar ABC transporter permease, partial [Chloroflexota bacterium]
LPEPQLTAARLTSAVFVVLAVAAVAVVDPLGGLLLGIHTWTIKYTSQAMLEALPALTSILTVLAYLGWKRGRAARAAGRRTRVRPTAWLVLSAVLLGITASGKYLYVVAGVAVLLDMLWVRWSSTAEVGLDRGRRLARALAPSIGWGLLAIGAFVATDPYLWPDPIGRLLDSLTFFARYANEAPEVANAGYPLWQPFVWLAQNDLFDENVFVVTLDVFITLLALVGIGRLWRRERTWVLWLVVALGFLLVWPTKWPQYVLVLSAPLALAAAQGLRAVLVEPFGRWVARVRTGGIGRPHVDRRSVRDLGRAAPWLVPGLAVLAVLLLFPLVYQAAMSLTDFSSLAIRDGLNGGVLREAALGLTGQVPAVDYQPFASHASSTRVSYAGFGLLWEIARGGVADLLVYTVLWTVLSVGLQAFLGVGVALLLARRGIRFRGWWRTIYILPWAIPEFIGAIFWFNIVEPTNGWIALALGGTFEWAARPEFALLVQLVAATWIGWPLLFLAATAGLAMIPREVYDAAAIDGAGAWGTFRTVTLPLLLPLVVPALIVRALLAFNQFYLFYALGADYATMSTVSFFLFNPSSRGFGGLFAASAALNIFIVVCLLVGLAWIVRRQRAGEVAYA